MRVTATPDRDPSSQYNREDPSVFQNASICPFVNKLEVILIGKAFKFTDTMN